MEKPAGIDALLSPHGLRLVCPLCKGPVESIAAGYCCAACRRSYPVVEGIPDFRVAADRFISIEEDRRKGLEVLARAPSGRFSEALDAYWSITQELAPELAGRHRAHQWIEADLAEQTLREIDRLTARNRDGPHPLQTHLDVGCGTAGLLLPASRRARIAVGADVALRWLLVGRLRLREAGLEAPLICANAEFLPFASEAFDLVTATDLLEHVTEPLAVMRECQRVAAPEGRCYFSTNNRYSLGPEPHVRLWGVGMLPRRMQSAYVRAARNHTYDKVRLLSRGELIHLARAASFGSARVSAAPLYAQHLGGLARTVSGLYNRIRHWPAAKSLFGRLGPRLQILCLR
jgi:ubiquinone/menaquinone biosynthesis C-methylase UbiE/uncharacterized protein YbaR (Trm112 family)